MTVNKSQSKYPIIDEVNNNGEAGKIVSIRRSALIYTNLWYYRTGFLPCFDGVNLENTKSHESGIN